MCCKRLHCEQVGYHLLGLWCLDRELRKGCFDHSVFAKNYERLHSAVVAQRSFAEVSELSRQASWARDGPFTADGMLIESRASWKSLVRKDGRVPPKCTWPGTKTRATRRSTSLGSRAATRLTRARPPPRTCSIGRCWERSQAVFGRAGAEEKSPPTGAPTSRFLTRSQNRRRGGAAQVQAHPECRAGCG